MPDGRKGIHVFSKVGFFGIRWFFHGRAGNGEITATSEAYNSRHVAYKGIRATAETFGGDIGRLVIFEGREQMDAFGLPKSVPARPKKPRVQGFPGSKQ